MFRIISIISFIIILVSLAAHCLFSRPMRDELFGKDRHARLLDGLRILIFLFTLLLPEQKLNIIGVLRKLIFDLALLCFAVLLITGFVPLIFLGKFITGYWLMIHATFAPIFAACVAVLAVMWAHNSRFDKNYWPWLQKILCHHSANTEAPEKYELSLKILFWLLIVLMLPIILSEVISMFPLFGTTGQQFMLATHRYTTLTFALAALVYLYLLFRTKTTAA